MTDYSDYIQDVVKTKKVGSLLSCILPHLIIILHDNNLKACY